MKLLATTTAVILTMLAAPSHAKQDDILGFRPGMTRAEAMARIQDLGWKCDGGTERLQCGGAPGRRPFAVSFAWRLPDAPVTSVRFQWESTTDRTFKDAEENVITKYITGSEVDRSWRSDPLGKLPDELVSVSWETGSRRTTLARSGANGFMLSVRDTGLAKQNGADGWGE